MQYLDKDLSVDEFVSQAAKILSEVPIEKRAEVLYTIAGVDPIKGFLVNFGATSTGVTNAQKTHKWINGVTELVKRKLVGTVALLKYEIAKDVKKTPQSCNYVDSYTRVANMGYSQELVPVNVKDIDTVGTVTHAMNEFIKNPSDKKTFTADFLSTAREVVVVKKNDQVTGIGKVVAGKIDYSLNGDSIKPLKFTPSPAAMCAFSSLLSGMVKVTRDVANPVEVARFSDEYLMSMNYDKLFNRPSIALNNIALACKVLVSNHLKAIPIVYGTGSQIELWCFHLMGVIMSASYKGEAFEDVNNVCITVNDYARQLKILCDKKASGALVLAYQPTQFDMGYSVGNTRRITNDMKAGFEDARKCKNVRRSPDGDGENGRSGLSLHTYFGMVCPPMMSDFISLASDWRLFVEIHNKELCLSLEGLTDYEVPLRALHYLGFSGTLYVNDKTVLKIMKKYDINKGKIEEMGPFTRAGTFSTAAYKIIVDSPGRDIPTLYRVLYGVKESEKDREYVENYDKIKSNTIKPLLKASVRLVNVILCKSEMNDATYTSLEAHNMTGWQTTCVKLKARLAEFSVYTKKWFSSKAADRKAIPRPVGYVFPFDEACHQWAYARSIIANVSRAQFFVTQSLFNVACVLAGFPLTKAKQGNIMGMITDGVMIDGRSLESICADAGSCAAYIAEGNEEIKQLVTMGMQALGKQLGDSSLASGDRDKIGDGDNKSLSGNDSVNNNNNNSVGTGKLTFDDEMESFD